MLSGEYAVLEVVEDLVRGARALLRASFHEALEVRGAVLAGEMAFAGVDVRLAKALVAAELRVLANLPIGVRAEQEWVRERHVEGGTAIPLLADARKDRLDLAEERSRELRHHAGAGGVASERPQRHAAAGVVDQDPGGAVLGAGDIPCVLVARVG